MRQVEIDGGTVVAYGDWGRPLIAFPSEAGDEWDWERHGMVDELGPLLGEGRVKLYCVPSYDRESWTRNDLPLEERAERHGRYDWWILARVVPFVQADSHTHEVLLAGTSFGAYHAANFCLKRADLFPLALCLSGVYDVSLLGGGPRGDAVYFNNPADYVGGLHGDHLDWLRSQANLVLVVGRGAWEDSTGSLDQTHRFAALLAEKGLRHELDVWGEDSPHDWPAWRAQIAHHLPRFA